MLTWTIQTGSPKGSRGVQKSPLTTIQAYFRDSPVIYWKSGPELDLLYREAWRIRFWPKTDSLKDPISKQGKLSLLQDKYRNHGTADTSSHLRSWPACSLTMELPVQKPYRQEWNKMGSYWRAHQKRPFHYINNFWEGSPHNSSQCSLSDTFQEIRKR